MAFLNKLLMQSLARAIKNRDPSEVAARQQASANYNGFLGNIDKSQFKKAIMGGMADRNRGPKAGFGGAGMAGGTGTKGMPSGGSAPSFAEIIQSRGGFPFFGGSKKNFMPAPEQPTAPRPEITGMNVMRVGNMPMPVPTFSQGQPTAPDMDQSFLLRLVQAGIYPDLETAMRGEAERRRTEITEGIATLMPKIAGSLFGRG